MHGLHTFEKLNFASCSGKFNFFIKLILPGLEFEPVISRVAGRRCPFILSHLTQVMNICKSGNHCGLSWFVDRLSQLLKK